MDSNFDAEWKEEVESIVSRYGSMSELCEDEFLDEEVEKGDIVKCIRIIRQGEVMDWSVNYSKYGGPSMVVQEWCIC